jgi:hypothetical protein
MRRINAGAAELVRRLNAQPQRDVDACLYTSRCPACQSHNFSLSIWALGNGEAVVHCFDCQDTDRILQETEMAVTDLEPKHAKEARLTRKIHRVCFWAVKDGSNIIIAAAKKMAAGEGLSESEYASLSTAAGRIAEASKMIASVGKPA